MTGARIVLTKNGVVDYGSLHGDDCGLWFLIVVVEICLASSHFILIAASGDSDP